MSLETPGWLLTPRAGAPPGKCTGKLQGSAGCANEGGPPFPGSVGTMRILSGVQSSGRLHLGNYYGAIRQFVQLQHEGEAFFFIANLHALTTVREAQRAV